MRSAALTILRIGAGLLFLEHGVQKLFGALGGFGSPGVTAPMMSRYGAAGWLEFVGGVLIVLGAFTRPVAFILAGEMLVAFYLAHLPRGGWPIQNAGELALLYLVIYVFLAANGAGPISVDHRFRIRFR
jgi:putative oxidoreductase